MNSPESGGPRPSSKGGFLRIDTSNLDLETPTKPQSRGRSFSVTIPSILSPAVKDSPGLVSPIGDAPSKTASQPLGRLRGEYRKLFRHVLHTLQHRARPANVFSPLQPLERSFSITSRESTNGFISISNGTTEGLRSYDSDEEDRTNLPDLEETCESLIQLRDALYMSEQQGLHILSSAAAEESSSNQRTSGLPFGRRRRSTVTTSDRPPTASLTQDEGYVLFKQCVSVLGDIIINDCRYPIAHPRPSRPPNSLQSICLDVAQCLAISQKGDAKNIHAIGLAVVPAFESFPQTMHVRLLEFFENALLRPALSQLSKTNGRDRSSLNTNSQDPFDDIKPAPGQPQISIQVAEPGNETHVETRSATTWKRWSTGTSNEANLISTFAPDLSLRVYYLASLVTPLLASILENVDLSDQSQEELYWIRRLLETVISLKPDSYLDMLEILAYHTPHSRRSALIVLATFWPKALGHTVVSSAIPFLRIPSTRSINIKEEAFEHPYAHEFLPWRFPQQPRRGSVTTLDTVPAKLSITPCRACARPVHDFGLLCQCCNSAVHFNCYDPPEGSIVTEYSSSPGVQKLAIIRFSHTLPARRSRRSHSITIDGHIFSPVNIFTLSLCFVCHEPIWGVARQGLLCSGCHACAHATCITGREGKTMSPCNSPSPKESMFTVDWGLLRKSFVRTYGHLVFTEEELLRHSFETVSVAYSLLWLQLQILNNGIAAGSILVEQANPTTAAAKANRVDDFELQYLVRLYEAYLRSDRLPKSEALTELRRLEGPFDIDYALLFDMSLLFYVSSLIKAIRESSALSTTDFLRPEPHQSAPQDSDAQPYEVTHISHPRDVLGQELGISPDGVAKEFLQYLEYLGLIERLDGNSDLFAGIPDTNALCIYPLPLSIDLSTNVETLFSAVEACLSDIDLMVNEAGFLLLIKRCWPSGLASTYAIDRLVGVVLQWIMKEDTSLLTVARDFIASKKAAPGVRSPSDRQPWPLGANVLSPSMAQGGPTAGGNEYRACRRALLEKYAIPWLLRAHNLDTAGYLKTLHEYCIAAAADESEGPTLLEQLLPLKEERITPAKIDVAFADATLKVFLRLCQAAVVFTTFDDLFMYWLDEISNHGGSTPMVVKSLPRIFNPESDPVRRSTVMGDLSFDQDIHISDLIDPWRSVTSTASEGVHGLTRALRWLLVLAQSGVDIPTLTFRQLSGYARDFEVSLDIHMLLVHAIFAAVWIQSLGRQDLTAVAEDLCVRNEEALAQSLRHNQHVTRVETDFIRLSLSALLVLYGLEREKVVMAGLVTKDESDALSVARRKQGRRLRGAPEKLDIGMSFVFTISTFLFEARQEVAAYVLKFVGLLVTQVTLFDPGEVDGFIKANSDTLLRIVWRSMRLTAPDLYDLRLKTLLQILVVSTDALNSLLDEVFDTHQPWHNRLESAGTLFSLILELNNAELASSETHWRARLSPVYCRFFSLIWEDDQELVRSAVETAADSLLPSHWQFIQVCWDEHLENLRQRDREHFVRYLLRLQPHFPNRSLISIRAIVDTLCEDESMFDDLGEEQDSGRRESILPHDSVDISSQHASQTMLVTLALNFVGHGIVIQPVDLVKIKLFLVRQLGFSKAFLRVAQDGTSCHVEPGAFDPPGVREQGLACLAAAKLVLDSSARMDVSPSMFGITATVDQSSSCLVGVLFVDAVLAVLNSPIDIMELSNLALRNWLEALIIVVLKHDLRSSVLRHLESDVRSAVLKTTEIFLLDIPYETRQLALTINQCFLKRWSTDGSTILSRQINAVAQLLSSLEFNHEDILVAQGRTFLTSAFLRFPNNGLFVLLLKNVQLSDVLFKAFSHTLKDCSLPDGTDGRQFALRDVMDKVFNYTNRVEFASCIVNMKRYVEEVYSEPWPTDLITEMGMFLSSVARHTVDWPSSDFECDAPLLMCATIAERNPASSRDLLLSAEMLLRPAVMRFDVHASTLERLLAVTRLVYSMPASTTSGAKLDEHHLEIAIVDTVRDAMMLKPRPTLLGVASMLEIARGLALSPSLHLPFEVPTRLAADCLTYMQSQPFQIQGSGGDRYSDSAFTVCIEAATIYVLALEGQKDALRAGFGVGAGQAMAGRAPQALRTWAFLALSVLSMSADSVSVSQGRLVNGLLRHTPDFAFAFCTLMQGLLYGSSVESTGDLTYVYPSLVLWMLLSQTGPSAVEDEMTVWLSIWSAFERVVVRSNGLEGNEISPIAPSVSNMYTDIIIFLFQSGSPLALSTTASHAALLTALRDVSRAESVRHKYARTLRALSDPPLLLSRQELYRQARSNLLAAEKLTYAFEMSKKITRPGRTG